MIDKNTVERYYVRTKKFELTKETFNTLCRALEKNNWDYKKNEEKIMIECSAQGDDLPIIISFAFQNERGKEYGRGNCLLRSFFRNGRWQL